MILFLTLDEGNRFSIRNVVIKRTQDDRQCPKFCLQMLYMSIICFKPANSKWTYRGQHGHWKGRRGQVRRLLLFAFFWKTEGNILNINRKLKEF
jgi:hypothetical protein